MINTIKTELYKIFSVRSTYVIMGLATLASLGLAFFGEGIKYTEPLDANKFSTVVLMSTQLISLLLAVIAILHMTNEYRYNTINYTLTSSNSRSKVLLAKVVSVSLLSILFTLFITVAVVGGTYAGLLVADANIPVQVFPLSVIARVVFYNLGIALFALLISVFLRSLAAALVMLLLGINILEGLLGILLKAKAIYLPMSSLNHVVGSIVTGEDAPTLSPLKASIIFSCYLVIGWILAWFTFTKRDAS